MPPAHGYAIFALVLSTKRNLVPEPRAAQKRPQSLVECRSLNSRSNLFRKLPARLNHQHHLQQIQLAPRRNRLSAWDTENDAREFFDACVKRAQLQYPNAERTNEAAIVTFGTSDGQLLVAFKGLRVFTIGAPRSVKAESLLCALDSNAPNCRPPMAMLFSR